jgi:predicted phosphoribosyltransferase
VTRPGVVDLDAIRERAARCEQYRDEPHDTIREWALAAVASAADVPALIAAVESLRVQRDNAEASESEAHEELARVRRHLADANRTIQALVGGAR